MKTIKSNSLIGRKISHKLLNQTGTIISVDSRIDTSTNETYEVLKVRVNYIGFTLVSYWIPDLCTIYPRKTQSMSFYKFLLKEARLALRRELPSIKVSLIV